MIIDRQLPFSERESEEFEEEFDDDDDEFFEDDDLEKNERTERATMHTAMGIIILGKRHRRRMS